MFKRQFGYVMTIYPHRDAFFKSSYTLSESVVRLASRVKDRRLIKRFEGGVFGTVKPEKVILQHFHPFRLYAGFLRFHGSFSERNGFAELSGKFEIPKCGRVWMNTWFVAALILFCFPFIFEISEYASSAISTLSIFMIFLWIFMIFISYRRGKIDDIEYISREINAALMTEQRHE